jgi:hypothetical protein
LAAEFRLSDADLQELLPSGRHVGYLRPEARRFRLRRRDRSRVGAPLPIGDLGGMAMPARRCRRAWLVGAIVDACSHVRLH